MNIIGNKYGRWTVLNFSHSKNNKRYYYKCKCDCGTTKIVLRDSLVGNKSTSCGCWHKERVTKHPEVNKKLYSIWHNMIDRCERAKHPMYSYYGGDNKSVCAEWRNDYSEFHRWAFNNGYNEGLSIDRIDNHKGYCPDNCKWILRNQQGSNRRNVIKLTYAGQTRTLKEWSKLSPVSSNTIWQRIRYGWSVKNAITLPSDRSRKRNR